ncbi:MAG TPA: porin [Rhodocyclaceae bacterium]|nr:porin [Rhodocyclaceae bacterium]
MQKKLIALAIAGLASSAAFAQSNVSIYGVVDAGVASYRATGALSSTKVISGGLSTSRLGFKGVEDLGNGLKALFTLEYRLDVDQNTGIGGNPSTATSGPARQQLLGLTGGFGTVAAGRLQTTAYDWSIKYITLGATAFDVAGNFERAGGFGINAISGQGRADNAVAYISPSMGGFTVAVNHALATEQTTGTSVLNTLNANLVGVYYDNGPASAGLVYEKLDGSGTSTGTEVADWALGGSYDFGAAKVTATYQTTQNKAPGLLGVQGNKNKVWQLGVTVPVSAVGAVSAQYASLKLDNTYNGAAIPTATTAASAKDDDAKGWSVAYTHNLSKRTTAYAGYGRIKNNGNTGLVNGVVNGGTAGLGNTPQGGGSSSVLAAGLRHTF